jgi:hypothetical protein
MPLEFSSSEKIKLRIGRRELRNNPSRAVRKLLQNEDDKLRF